MVLRTLRVHHLDGTMYDWINPLDQRATSPPPGSYLSLDALLPYPERTVKISVERGRRLGLVIRGGMEYGLGIFISGIDRGSLSEQSGLSVGDQILSVNGTDFRQISHQEAVQILREHSRLTVNIRQMKKLPQPKAAGEPIENERLRPIYEFYRDEKIDVEQFLRALRDQFNEQERVRTDPMLVALHRFLVFQEEMFKKVRPWIRKRDLDRWDILLLKEDLEQLKVRTDLSLRRRS